MKRFLYVYLLSAFIIFHVPAFADAMTQESEVYGEMIQIDNHKLHLNCLGSGRPVVVFDSGLGGFSMDWLKVQRELFNETTVCAYDRAGYGWSEEGPSPRITDQIVDELYELLEQADIEPPFILVGHSFGGYNVQYFSKLYPKLVAGIILIESSHPDQFERLPDIPARVARSSPRNRLMTMLDPSVLRVYPKEHQILARRFLASDKSIRTQQREFLNFTQSGFQVSQINRQLDIPLTVITRAERVWQDTPYGEQQEQIWMALQKDLLTLSTDSRQVFAEFSGHLVHLQQPELVAKSIREMIVRICQLYPDYVSETNHEIMVCHNSISKP